MFKISFQLNGRTVTPTSFGNSMEGAILNQVAEHAVKVIRSKLTPEEQDRVSIKIEGENLKSLSLNLSGPEEILAKVKADLEQ
jgi:hypothetical protein